MDDGPGADARFMAHAIDLALRGLGMTSPNPLVGAVVVAGGRIVGEGWHQGPGTHHAEVMALLAAGNQASGGTLYVTLEPCSHVGRTPPCAQIVREARMARVVAAGRDPNPVVDGRGFALLRDGGIEVREGVLEARARRLNLGFARHVRTGRPFVTMKLAASLDGRVAARDGSARWITGEAARRDAHRLRAASGAVMVGAGTAVADDPSLTVRLDGYRGRQPLRVIVDGRGRTPLGARVMDGAAPTLMVTSPAAGRGVRAAWEAAGADVLVQDEADPAGRIALGPLMETLGKRDIQDVLIEGGPTVAGAAVASGVVDRMIVYLAPKLIGGARAPGALGGPGVASVAEAVPLDIVSVDRIGDDIRVEADVHRDR